MSKVKSWLRYAAIVAAAVLLALGAYFLVDVLADRRVGDWFEQQFMYVMWYSNPAHKEIFFRWDTFKRFVLTVLLAGTAAWTGSILVTYALGIRREKKHMEEQARDFEQQMLKKEREIQLETSQKNDLIAYLAHDLKTPMTSVIGYLSLLEEAPEMPQEQTAKCVHIALDKAFRLEGLINEFFEITRYNLHQMILDKRKIDLGYMLSQMADEFYPVLRDHGNTVCLDASENLEMLVDAAKLARVFNNILKNAVAYSHEGTPIRIAARQEGEKVTITFTNEGQTIPEQKLASIFDKFYRLDESRGTNTGGAGLGLAIAREIVTAHGGTITAASREGETTFTVELPV